MKPFNEKFADNLREVFDNWQEPVDEKAWQQMRGRLQSNHGKAGMFLFSPLVVRAAATVAILVTISFSAWYFSSRNTNEFDFQLTNVPKSESVEPADNDSLIAEDTGSKVNAGNEAMAEPGEISEEKVINLESDRINQSKTPNTIAQSSIPFAAIENKTLDVEVSENEYDAVAATLPVVTSDPLLATDFSVSEDDSLRAVAEIIQSTVTDNLESDNITDQLPYNQLASEQEKIINANLREMEEQESTRSTSPFWEVSAGSVSTYSWAEVAGGMGVSAGVTGNWPISPKWSFSGGGVLVFNQFSLANAEDAVALSFTRNDMDYESFTPDFSSVDGTRFYSSGRSTDVEFTAVDIPLNFRYRLANINKNSIYLTAGLSSLVYLQQSYRTNTSYLTQTPFIDTNGLLNYSSDQANLTDEGDFDAFGRVDLARFMNVSMGYLIAGRRQSLLIEPYLKYPLGNVTSLDLYVGMAGINLKYQFSKP